MIREIYITDYLSVQALQPLDVVEAVFHACPALADAEWRLSARSPLKQLFAGLQASSDHLPAQIAAVLARRLPAVLPAPAFCVLPVHLALQRDTVSLQGTVTITPAVYSALTACLQQHFTDDFRLLPDPAQVCWWMVPVSRLNADCPWPQEHLFQQAFAWQPQGADAQQIRQWSNEIQMLLHQLAAHPPLPDWPEALNSAWFASVTALPIWQHHFLAVCGKGEVFDGLVAAGLPAVRDATLAAHLTQAAHQPTLFVVDSVSQLDWPALSQALQQGRVSQLRCVLPFAEQSLEIHFKRRSWWQCWRKPHTLATLMQSLQAAM